MQRPSRHLLLASLLAASLPVASRAADPSMPPPPLLRADGSVQVPEHVYPMPGSFSPEAQHAFADYYARGGDPAFSGDIRNIRHIYDTLWAGPVLDRWKALYPVKAERTMIAGVTVDIVTPPNGVAADKRGKVLISLHGGGFTIGNGGPGGQVEAVPMAAIGGYKVIAVDYRQAPEAKYPAATDDAEAVYKALLKTYKPQDIGVYGSSAGGMLTAQLVARLMKSGLPLPGAIAIMAAGATKRGASDSSFWTLGLTGASLKVPTERLNMPSYFSPSDLADPDAAPAESPGMLAKFPPTLVLSSSRDAALGSALDTYAKLREAGVESSLYVRHGFGHGYFTQAPEVPESIAAWREAIHHFDKYLGHMVAAH